MDLGESFPTSIYYLLQVLQNLSSIQPRTSLAKFARSLRVQIAQVQRAANDSIELHSDLEVLELMTSGTAGNLRKFA